MLSRLTPADRPLRITEFAQRLAAASAGPNTKMPRTTLFTDWLLENGYLEKVPDGENKMRRIPTDRGPEHRAVHGSPCGQIWRVPGHLL